MVTFSRSKRPLKNKFSTHCWKDLKSSSYKIKTIPNIRNIHKTTSQNEKKIELNFKDIEKLWFIVSLALDLNNSLTGLQKNKRFRNTILQNNEPWVLGWSSRNSPANAFFDGKCVTECQICKRVALNKWNTSDGNLNCAQKNPSPERSQVLAPLPRS